MHRLKIFNRIAAGSFAILLASCTNLKAPKTLFITFGAEREHFKDDAAQARSFLNKYTEAFQRSNPDVNIVYITYKSNKVLDQIEHDSTLNLGPDVVITEPDSARSLLTRDLAKTLPNQQYFDTIYDPRIQSEAKINNEYTFAPWLINTQIACFNNTTIKESPGTIGELEELSASGKKIGLSSRLYELGWTAGTQGAISEISSLGNMTEFKQTYPAIQRWLQWLQKAALYQNIYFHENSRELGTKLKNNELDWVTCWGSQLEDLEKTMGNSLGVAALPDGPRSKAYPGHLVIGFSLGKDSSKDQRKMATKFIKTAVNTIAQRKIQLDYLGYLAANKNVSIPPKSSKKLEALNTSFNKQSNYYLKEIPGIDRYVERYPQLGSTLRDLINGYLDVDETLKIITTTQTN